MLTCRAWTSPSSVQSPSPTVMEEEAVSESGLQGFRRRWAGRSEQGAVLDDSDPQDLEDPLDVDRLILELDLQDNHWEVAAFSLDDDSKDGGSDQLENRSQHSAAIPHLQATAKSRPQPSSWSSGYDRQSVKRLADDLACRAIRKRWKDMKQSWQVGPLASLFSRPISFWQQGDVIHSIGFRSCWASFTTISSPAASVEKLAVVCQRIRTSQMINDEEDFRRVSLDRLKTMILCQLDAAKLG